MRTLRWLALVAVVLAALSLGAGGAAAAGNGRNFVAHLAGSQETPPNSTLSQGEAIFHLSPDGSTLSYKLIVANIDNVTVAHIHLGMPGVAGPVVVFLYHGPTIAGRFDGVLAEGTITAADLTGPLAGQSLSTLLNDIRSGDAYVNVHTTQFPAGQIRGQIH
ncbi:MAG TPA: CHRD domain-containing protein [Thermomicrobiales bacterium]|nr:CHRD domain-containing protein [Thermomicrobiales bacterium]